MALRTARPPATVFPAVDREPACVVVERGAEPGRGGVARDAARREPGRTVVRRRASRVVGAVAGVAVGALPVVDTVAMAGDARGRRVGSREGKLRRRMIEHGAGPGGGRVAVGTHQAESGRRMRRVSRPFVRRPVTRVTIGTLPAIHGVRMAGVARHRPVRAGQRETRCRVIEDGSRPRAGVMAGCARGGESCRCVRRIG